jgi:hypothetical protein
LIFCLLLAVVFGVAGNDEHLAALAGHLRIVGKVDRLLLGF